MFCFHENVKPKTLVVQNFVTAMILHDIHLPRVMFLLYGLKKTAIICCVKYEQLFKAVIDFSEFSVTHV